MTIPVYVPELYEVALQAWALSVLGFPVNFAEQQAPAPLSKPYATLLVLATPKLSSAQQTEYLPGTDQLDLQVVSRYQGIVSVNIFSNLHASAMNKLGASMDRGSVRDANRANGLVVAYITAGPRRLSVTSNGVVETRSQADFVFRFAEVQHEIVDTFIDNVVITNDIG